MSYGVKYRITFGDDLQNNTDVWNLITTNWENYTGEFTASSSWQIDLLTDGYTGAITSLSSSGRKVGGVPLIIQGENNDDDPLFPILPTEVLSDIFSTTLFEFDEFFSGDERTFQYRVYLNSNLEQIGWLTPDGGYDLYADTPYRIQLRGICGLSQLKGIPYDNSGTAYSGKQTLLSIILNCLNKLEFEINLYTAVNFWEEDMNTSNDMLGQIWVDADTWVRDGETMSCYDVLFNIAYRCNAIVFQREGKWHFIRIAQYYQETDNVLRTLALEPILTLSGEELTILGTADDGQLGYTRYEYDFNGTLLDTVTHTPNVTAGPSESYQLRAINNNHVVMVRQPWKKATIIYNHLAIPNLAIDADFEPNDFTDSGTYLNLQNWIEVGAIVYQGVFQNDVEGSTMGLKITTEVAVEDTYEANYIIGLGTAIEWDTSDQLVVRLKYKFEGFATVDQAKWYYTLRLTDQSTSTVYYHNGSTWSTTPGFSATLEGTVLNAQTDYQDEFALPSTFDVGTLQMQLHGIFDAGSAASPSVTIDNVEIIHYNPTRQQSDKGEIAVSRSVSAKTGSVLSIEGEQELVTGEGRTNFTKGAWLTNLAGTTLPGTWSREGKGEAKTLDQVNLQSIMNIRYFGSRIIEGTYRGMVRYGDVIVHHGFDNRYFMVKRFIFNAKLRKSLITMHEVKDIDTVALTYTTIIE